MSMEMKYPYVGLYVTLLQRYAVRRTEWWSTFHIIGYGLCLIVIPGVFDNGKSWSAAKDIFGTPLLLGLGMVAIGVFRLVGLYINGTRPVVTPVIRKFGALGGAMVWGGLFYVFAMSGAPSVWISLYGLLTLNEFENIYRASHDQGRAANGVDH